MLEIKFNDKEAQTLKDILRDVWGIDEKDLESPQIIKEVLLEMVTESV